MALFLPLFVGQGDLKDSWRVLCFDLGKGGRRWDEEWRGKTWDPEDLGHKGQYLSQQEQGWPEGQMELPTDAAIAENGSLGANLQSARLSLKLALLAEDAASPVAWRNDWLATGNCVAKGRAWMVQEVADIERKVVATALWGQDRKVGRVRLLVPAGSEAGLDTKVERLLKNGPIGLRECRRSSHPVAWEFGIEVNDQTRVWVEVIPVKTVEEAWSRVVLEPQPAPWWVLAALGALVALGLANSPVGAAITEHVAGWFAAPKPVVEPPVAAAPLEAPPKEPAPSAGGVVVEAGLPPLDGKPSTNPNGLPHPTASPRRVEPEDAALTSPPQPERTDQGSRRSSSESNSLRTDPTNW